MRYESGDGELSCVIRGENERDCVRGGSPRGYQWGVHFIDKMQHYTDTHTYTLLKLKQQMCTKKTN